MAAGALIAGPKDAPLVVLIHGLGGSHHTWDRVLPLIEQYARVYALNLAGSDSIEQDADLAAELIPERALLVGHSRGGLVATAIAERHGHLARRLILLCTRWARQSRLTANRTVERAMAAPLVGDLIWTVASDAQRQRALSSAFATGTPIPDQFVADLRATGRRRFVAASRAIDAYLAKAPLAVRLAALGVPAELIFGQYDARIAPPPLGALPHMLLAAVGHTPPWEAPEYVAALISTALNGERYDPVEQDTQAAARVAGSQVRC
jgi:pimeloyl-ACP methyl ester carboxylesterase